MGVVLDELDVELIDVVKLEVVEEMIDVFNVREGISTAIAYENGKIMGNVGEVVHRRLDFSIVFQVEVYSVIVVFRQYSMLNNFSTQSNNILFN